MKIPDVKVRMLLRFSAPLFFAVFFLTGNTAHAHKVKIFAAVEGNIISGYAYYTSSSRPQNVPVVLTGPGGVIIDELQTDENGEFQIQARYRIDTLVKLDSPDGHYAEWQITAEEFPADLPPLTDDSVLKKTENPPAADFSDAVPQTAISEMKLPVSTDELASIVKMELLPLQKQVNQIRAQLDQQEEKKRFQDILGGIGYLLGLTGIAFYFAAKRRRGQQ